MNCSLPRLALLLQARRVLAGVLLFVCSRKVVCIHLLWGGCGHGSRRASDPCSGRFRSQGSSDRCRFLEARPSASPGLLPRARMVPQPDPLLRKWHPREVQPCSWAAAGASPTQLDAGDPLRAALAVVSVLRWVKVTVPNPATLQAVMWCPSSGFSLWCPGSHGLGTTHRGATHGGRERREE